MTLTLLIDLDDTLLDTHLEEFVPAYFRILAAHLSTLVPPDKLLQALMAGTEKMMQNEDPECNLKEVFESDFYPRLEIRREELEPAIEDFYNQEFPKLGSLTKPRQDAQELIAWTKLQGYLLAVATDPLFPRKATYNRLGWAGLDFKDFSMVSTYEKFHFSKNHPAYYGELLGQMGWPGDPIVMIGNDFDRDISPAQQIGLATFQVTPDKVSGGEFQGRNSKGDLQTLRSWLQNTQPENLKPDFHSRDAQIALMTATPAALDALFRGLDQGNWTIKTSLEDWALIEIVCHLRDSEIELNQMQIQLFGNGKEPFIPRPDAAVWARQRNYLEEDPDRALAGFIRSRKQTIDILVNLPIEAWEIKAKHSIFGPTNFLEVIGFMTEHDRLHTHQVWKTMQFIQTRGGQP